jgi:hypothetical protein
MLVLLDVGVTIKLLGMARKLHRTNKEWAMEIRQQRARPRSAKPLKMV